MNPRAVALQGIGYTPTLVALQGFGPTVIIDEGGEVHRSRRLGARLTYFENEAVAYNLAQLHQEDEAVTDLLITLVTKGFFDGKFQS